jgi:hypothetical protein
MADRKCRIAPASGHLVVRLLADNALQTGARFGVWDRTGQTLLEQWTMSAGVAGFSDHTVGTPSALLDGALLTWKIIVCSHDRAIDSGTVEVAVIQDGQGCETTPAAVYELERDVPSCEDGRAIPITDELEFDH